MTLFLSRDHRDRDVLQTCVMSAALRFCTRVHVVAVNVGAAVAAADAGEGGDGVSVAVTVTERSSRKTVTEKVHILCSVVYELVFIVWRKSFLK